MDTLNLPLEQAMSALIIPSAEQPKYRKLLQRQQPKKRFQKTLSSYSNQRFARRQLLVFLYVS